MQDNIPDALSAAFERHYDFPWNDPSLRNERLAWRAAWVSAMEQVNTEVQAAWIAKQDEVRSQRPALCLHQIQEPTVSQQLTVGQKPLTDAQIDAVFNRLPDGASGFLKTWGYLQFARELLAMAAPVQAAVDAPVATTVEHDSTPLAPVAVGERTDLYPGVMRCAKCDFQLVRAVLSVQSGQIHAGDSKTEPCPNGCGPLWPVTYKEYAKQAMDSADAMADRAIAAEKEVETLRAALAATPAAVVTDAQIKAVFLANGFTIKEGLTDLKPYVYQAARALLAGVSAPAGVVLEGWKWMTHPSRNDGKPLPVFLSIEHGVTYYQVFDTDSTAFEWELRGDEWREVAPQQADARDAAPDEARDKVTLALGLSLPPQGAPHFAWSYLLGAIRELVKCEEELTLLKVGAEMSKGAAPAASEQDAPWGDIKIAFDIKDSDPLWAAVHALSRCFALTTRRP